MCFALETIFYPKIPLFYHISVYLYLKPPNILAEITKKLNIIMNLLAKIHLLIHY